MSLEPWRPYSPGRGALKGKPDDPGRLHEQHTNKQVCGNSAPGNRTHTSVELLPQCCGRIKADLKQEKVQSQPQLYQAPAPHTLQVTTRVG